VGESPRHTQTNWRKQPHIAAFLGQIAIRFYGFARATELVGPAAPAGLDDLVFEGRNRAAGMGN